MLSTIVCITLVGILSGSTFAQGPVKISVHYESLCPDSVNFITTQLWPTYQQIPEIMNVDFVPFGKANFTQNGTGWDFVCQHGPRECEGNKIHSCELNFYPANSVSVEYIYCSMSAPDPVIATQGCAEAQGLDWTAISTCAYSDVGSGLLKLNGDRTQSLNPPLTFVPWVVINDVYTQANELQALSDLLGLVCDNYQGTPPAACPVK